MSQSINWESFKGRKNDIQELYETFKQYEPKKYLTVTLTSELCTEIFLVQEWDRNNSKTDVGQITDVVNGYERVY